ncbi:NAC domain-containing protein 72-like [Olea europaea var. sylvestris]|uniref:NAC domain-containing protein 72-like n=1 Tax=Olea europaea var. sylvestris TaxID=158386 RepID=UPI000C1D3074|nr:NAC domain-containing protein 72-like [Olea europaea var. sylvestris]
MSTDTIDKGKHVVMAAQESSNFHVEETIPPGYRFMPTDKELLHYLNLKILNKRISTDAIKDVDVYKYHPNNLCRKFLYFLMFLGGSFYIIFLSYLLYLHSLEFINKATGGDIIVQSKGQEVGRKKVLVYYERKSDNSNKGTKTNWIMHEFTSHQMKDVACSSTNAIPDDKMLNKEDPAQEDNGDKADRILDRGCVEIKPFTTNQFE